VTRFSAAPYSDQLRIWARKLPRPVKSLLKQVLGRGAVEADHKRYRRWVQEFDTLAPDDRAAIRTHIGQLTWRPLISVIMPVYNPQKKVLREAIESVRHQLYPDWELCIADDASSAPHVTEILREFAYIDQRIKWLRRPHNGHISAASNSALTLATGEFVALMDHDDLLSERALYEVAAALNEDRQLDILYSDEDQIDAKGRRSSPYFKTDWNIDLLLGHNMISHLGVYRRSLVTKVGGFREGFEGSQDYDLALQCADAISPGRIRHIPSILYHWRRAYGPASYSEARLAQCAEAARRAIADHLMRRGEKADVLPHPEVPIWSRVKRKLPDPAPLVSLVVPTRDRSDLLRTCMEGVLERTSYPALEVLIVDNDSVEAATLDLFEELQADSRVRVLKYHGAFNFSAANNFAVAQARGSIIGLINNDIEIIHADWLNEMVSFVHLNEVGAVGAKLMYPDGMVQHGGVVLGVGGVANHFNHLLSAADPGYFGRNVFVSGVSAVTAACLLIRKTVYEEVGGFNEVDLPVAFNDVDFCLRVMSAGYRNVWTPHAKLCHHESASRGSDMMPENITRYRREIDYMRKTWGDRLERDPFYNINLSLEPGELFKVAIPPRAAAFWRTERGYGRPAQNRAAVEAPNLNSR